MPKEGFDMGKCQRMSLAFLLAVVLVVTSSPIAFSQVDTQSWIKRRLTRNAGKSFNPVVAMSGNYIHVVWYDNSRGNYEIFYKRSSDNGATWGKAKRLTNNFGSSYTPAIAAWGSNIHVVWYDYTPFNAEIYYKRSIDNGVTWGPDRRLTNNAGDSFEADVAVSGNNVHVVWYDYTPGNWEIFYKRSTNNGTTWSKKRRLTNNVEGSYVAVVAAVGNNVHVVWEDDRPGNIEIYYRRSTNNGISWGKKKRLTKSAGTSYNPRLAVSGNNIHVVWYDNTPGNDEIFYKRSTDSGTTWGTTRRLTSNVGDSWSPDVAVSGSNVSVVWEDVTSGDWEIYYKSSTNNGTTWGKKKRLTHNPGYSEDPTIALSGNKAHVVWEDDNPGNYEIFYTRGP
jgi:hypothetical protein